MADMLAQLEDAQRDLMRALQLLDEPLIDVSVIQAPAKTSPTRTVEPPPPSPVRPAAGTSVASIPASEVPPKADSESDALTSFKLQTLAELRELRAQILEDEERAQAAIRERDAEIARLRRQVADLEQHHYLPPLALRYEPPPPPTRETYRGPLLLPQVKIEQSPAHYTEWHSMPPAERSQAEHDVGRMAVCYMLDGSEKYTPMTLNAIRSLVDVSPGVPIGIVTPDVERARALLQGIPAQFHFAPTSTHFAGWNATQFKLDILKFADLFDAVVWMDSDTFVYRDIRPLLLQFYRSQRPFAFMPDLVMTDPSFRTRWPGDKRRLFVPQASLMMFRSADARQLFARWEERWREWIFPVPFARYADPMPGFEGSAFCIEQYALGMALEDLLQDVAQDIYQLGREQLFLQLGDDETLELLAVPFAWTQGIAGLSGVSSYGSARLLTLSMAAGLNTSARLVMQGSYAGSLATSSGGLVYGPVGYHMLDHVANCVLHLYNTRYEAVFSILRARTDQVLEKLAKVSITLKQ